MDLGVFVLDEPARYCFADWDFIVLINITKGRYSL